MDSIIFLLLTILIMIVVYQHASGEKPQNKWVILLLCLLSLFPSLLMLWLGWRKNPARAEGKRWQEVI